MKERKSEKTQHVKIQKHATKNQCFNEETKMEIRKYPKANENRKTKSSKDENNSK